MQDLNSLDLNSLIDLLSENTAVYTRLLSEKKRNDEFNKVKSMIKLLQTIINERKTQRIGPGYIPMDNTDNPVSHSNYSPN